MGERLPLTPEELAQNEARREQILYRLGGARRTVNATDHEAPHLTGTARARWRARAARLIHSPWKTRVLGFLSIGGAAAALWWVIAHFDAGSFREQVAHLNAAWILAAVVFDLASYLGQGLRWHMLLRPVAEVPCWCTTRAIYAGLFLNEIVPFRPGEVLRGLVIARESNSPIMRIVPSIAAERLMDGFWLILAVCGVSLFGALPQPLGRFSWLAAAAATAVAIVLAFARRRIPAAWLAPLRNWRALAVSSGILFSQGLAVWAVLRGCGLPLSLFAGIAVMLVIRVGTMLPGAPANLGTHQLSTMLGLSLFGVSRVAASSVAFIVFTVLTVPLWLGGAAAMGSLGLPVRSVLSSAFGRRRWRDGQSRDRFGPATLTMEVEN